MSGGLGRLARVLYPVLLSTVVAVVAFWGVGELVARWRIPFVQTRWPSRTEERSGTTFQPGAEVRWTNGVDFWTTTPVNDSRRHRPQGLPLLRSQRVKRPGAERVLAA